MSLLYDALESPRPLVAAELQMAARSTAAGNPAVHLACKAAWGHLRYLARGNQELVHG